MTDSGPENGAEQAAGRNWSDLAPRVISAIVMAAIGATLIWVGGIWFQLGLSLIAGGMVWELSRMQEPGQGGLAAKLAVIAALTLFAATFMPQWVALVMLVIPSLAIASLLGQMRPVFIGFAAMIMVAAFAMVRLRVDFGISWLLWLVAVIVVTDVAGYFAGRMFGGPKFWPRISPKKTWSGTAAGWVGAAVIGLVFGLVLGAGAGLVVVSIAVSFASQMGDIAESAIKRRAGVKDSSNLIPGHGGLLDRFDGMLGGSLFLMLAGPYIGFPPVIG
ncbi:MAG: phosphatidate cytidylyltransferase [Pseudooceanicola sp.]